MLSKIKNSQEAKSGESGGWENTAMFSVARN